MAPKEKPDTATIRLPSGAEIIAPINEIATIAARLGLVGHAPIVTVAKTKPAPTASSAKRNDPLDRDGYVQPTPRGHNAELVLTAARALGAAGGTFTKLRLMVRDTTGSRIPVSSTGHAIKQLIHAGKLEQDGEIYRVTAAEAAKSNLRAVK